MQVKGLSSSLNKLASDVISIISSGERQKTLLKDPLYSNAIYLLLANMVNALFGFAFWIIVARFYSPENVGLASAAISAASLLTMLASLGLSYGLIRFLHSSQNPITLINSSFTLGGLLSMVSAVIFILGMSFWSPALIIIRENPIYLAIFILYIAFSTLSWMVDNSFIAGRKAGFILIKSLILNILKLSTPVLLATVFFTFGIFSSLGISTLIALLLSLFLFLPRAQPGYRLAPAFDIRGISSILRFSFANYIGDLLWSAPVFILPIMVVNFMGAETNAYFYIAWVTGGVLNMIPTAVSTSLFAECSYEEETMGHNIRRSLKMVFLILVPTVILILAIADRFLLLFGGSYSENATSLLRLLAISALPSAINIIYLGIKRVEKKVKVIVGLTACAAVITFGLAYLLLPRIGINGVGIAWLTSQGVIALVIIAVSLKNRGLLR